MPRKPQPMTAMHASRPHGTAQDREPPHARPVVGVTCGNGCRTRTPTNVLGLRHPQPRSRPMTLTPTAFPRVVSATEWQRAHDALLAKEKEWTHAKDALSAERR